MKANPPAPPNDGSATVTSSMSAGTASGSVNVEYVERCQLEYERNPRSRIFAPLAEAYRKMGMLDEALRACATGVSFHPDFAGGRVTYAKCWIDRGEHAKALEQLEQAAQLSPDNLLAHSLMGETLLALRRPKDALKAFKMALFLNPRDERARQAVRKWEFLTAEDYEDDLFIAHKLGETIHPASEASDRIAQDPPKATRVTFERELERALSLADAFTVRHNLESAMQVLKAARERMGALPEIENRLKLLGRRAQVLEHESPQQIRPLAKVQAVGPRAVDSLPRTEALGADRDARKRNFLRSLLARIEAHRALPPDAKG